MKIISVITELNQGKKMPVLSSELGISKDTLRKRLNDYGYKYDNSEKKYVFVGSLSEKEKINNMELDVKNKNKVRNKSEKVHIEVVKKDDKENIQFSEEEVKILKDFSKKVTDTDLGLFMDLAFLPSNAETKKSSIIISKQIHDDFELFAEKYANRRISKNSLIELALDEFMRKYR
ncbi:hypothetical protein OCE52_24310 [Bacillus mobilis]|uniref:hypothetical protein n=1 Tax=Bacillus mobilis TaxID=2026190 RepID=UPI0021D3BCAA|nr:hypothetical protein [Bacillus mobilis]MCU5197923.1 hypothetical protein [Bacillus mobilis]